MKQEPLSGVERSARVSSGNRLRPGGLRNESRFCVCHVQGRFIFVRLPVILQVLPALGTGGLEQGALEIGSAIVQGGGASILASQGGPLAPQLQRLGIEHVNMEMLRKSPVTIVRAARTLERLIRERGVNIVHARSRIPAWAAWLATRRTGVPLVTTWHGVHDARWWGKELYNSALIRGDRVIAVSHYIAGRLVQEYGLSSERMRVIPRGADALRFDPDRVSAERVQAQARLWGVPHGARVILMPARLTRWKGQGVLLAALAQLRTVVPSGWVCVFVGPETDSAFATWLSKRVHALCLGENVRFAGTCPDMPTAYALADIVVAPSLRPEPFGRTVVEAQLMGKSVIGTAQGAMVETILPGKTGFVVPPDDPVALAKTLEKVLQAEAEEAACLSESARAHVLKHYTTRRMQAETLSVYDELLGTALRPRFEGQCHHE